MALEEGEGVFVELADVLADRGVRAHLKDDELAVLDAAPEGLDEAGRRHNVLSAERDLCRRCDLVELAKRIMGDERVRLTEESVDRLFWPAAHEGRELLDIFGLGRVKLRREAEGKDPLDHHLLDAAETLGDGLPVADDGLQERVALRPAGMQRQRLDPLGIFAGEPQASRAAQREAAHMRLLDADRAA